MNEQQYIPLWYFLLLSRIRDHELQIQVLGQAKLICLTSFLVWYLMNFTNDLRDSPVFRQCEKLSMMAKEYLNQFQRVSVIAPIMSSSCFFGLHKIFFFRFAWIQIWRRSKLLSSFIFLLSIPQALPKWFKLARPERLSYWCHFGRWRWLDCNRKRWPVNGVEQIQPIFYQSCWYFQFIFDSVNSLLSTLKVKAVWMQVADRNQVESVGSAAILCLNTEVVLYHVSFVPTSHLFRLWYVLCIICSASHPFASHLLPVSSVLRLIRLRLICSPSHLFCVSSVPRLTCSASHLFRVSLCASSIPCPTYSVSQDLDHFPTLRSCLNCKPRLGINHAWRELRREQKDVYRENSTSCILKSLIRSDTQFNLFIDEIFAWPFDRKFVRQWKKTSSNMTLLYQISVV